MVESAAIEVTIVVPCRNEARYLQPFLESLLAQEGLDFPWEVVIADGMSDDGSRAILFEFARKHPSFSVIDNPERIAPAALNRAIRRARGAIIIRMDVHSVYAPDYVRECAAALRRSGAQNVGGPTRTIPGGGLVAKAITAAYHSALGSGGAKFHRADFEGDVDTVMFGCWWKADLLRLGLFDERLVRNQDDELNYRIVRSGGRIYQTPRIRFWYHPRNTLRRLFVQYFQYGLWKPAVIRKHGAPASPRHCVPALFVAFAAALPVLGGAFAAAELPVAAMYSLAAWAAMLAAYAAACLWASVRAAAGGPPVLAAILPFVFATYHVAYGVGFLAGLPRARRFQPLVRPARLRRLADILLSSAGLLLGSPLLGAIAAAIVIGDGRPCLFRQTRAGLLGRPFRILKFRTMRTGCAGARITAAGDSRVTGVGRFLRKYKLDELPQFWNVLRGDMSLVGPRPEAPEFVDSDSPLWIAVLRERPGVTDAATLVFRNEEELLRGSTNVERDYRERILPEKLRLNLEYAARRSFRSDLKILWLTAAASLLPARFDPARLKNLLFAGETRGF